jgi:putative Mg2+ transporter-C (MgtC) family protein
MLFHLASASEPVMMNPLSLGPALPTVGIALLTARGMAAVARTNCERRAMRSVDVERDLQPFARVWEDGVRLAQVAATLTGAALLGGLQGLEREWLRKPAGLRTHMLVALGAAVFVIVPREAGMTDAELGRVVQGVAAGVGFIGAGTILKLTAEREIQGLTTAASLWLAAAIGVAVGAGLVWVPVVSCGLALAILGVLGAAHRPEGSDPGAVAPPRQVPRSVEDDE